MHVALGREYRHQSSRLSHPWVVVIAILRLLPDITMHVEEYERIGSFFVNRVYLLLRVHVVPDPDIEDSETFLVFRGLADSVEHMIRCLSRDTTRKHLGTFGRRVELSGVSAEDRNKLIALARDWVGSPMLCC
jgi:hypothetical protein